MIFHGPTAVCALGTRGDSCLPFALKTGPAVDIYALGSFIFELVTGKIPYHRTWRRVNDENPRLSKKNPSKLTTLFQQAVLLEVANGVLPDVQEAEVCMRGCGHLLDKCFQSNPSDRPSAAALHGVL